MPGQPRAAPLVPVARLAASARPAASGAGGPGRQAGRERQAADRERAASLGDMPLGAFVDWRKAVPTKKPAEQAASPAPAASETPAPAEAATPPVGPAAHARLLQIYQRLSVEEQVYVRQLINRVPAEVRDAFLAELATLPFDEALARVRRELRSTMSSPPNGHAAGGAGSPTGPGAAVPTASHVSMAPIHQPPSAQHPTEPSRPTPPAVSSPSAPIPSAGSVPTASAAMRNSVPLASTPVTVGEATPVSASHAFTTTAAPTIRRAPADIDERMAALHAVMSTIWNVLSPTERDEAQRFLESLTFEQQAAWLVELERLSLPDAIAWMRSLFEARRAGSPAAVPATLSAAGTAAGSRPPKAMNGAP